MKCPVCCGRGTITGKLYSQVGEMYYNASATEVCTSCGGNGEVQDVNHEKH